MRRKPYRGECRKEAAGLMENSSVVKYSEKDRLGRWVRYYFLL